MPVIGAYSAITLKGTDTTATDVSTIKDATAELKSDVAVIKADVAVIKTNTTPEPTP